MYRIISFKDGNGKTLARFHTEEEVATYHSSAQDESRSAQDESRSAQDESRSASGETTKKYCVVEFERGTDNCRMLAQFDTPEESAKYYETVKDQHEPFGPLLVLALELQPGGDYDDLQRKPRYRQSKGKK